MLEKSKQSEYPKVYTICHINQKFFFWTILLENAQIEKYILCVTEALTAALEKQPLGPNLQKGCFEMCFRLDMWEVFKNTASA